jgi:hypothetical protein
MSNVNTLHERRSLTGVQSFVSVSRVYCVNIYNVLIGICEIYYTTKWKWFTSDYLLMSLVGDGVKYLPRCIIR